MNAGLADLIERHDPVVRLEDAHASSSRHAIKYALARRCLVSVVPGISVEVDRIPDVEVRERAALLRAGEEAAPSHFGCLRRGRRGVVTFHRTATAFPTINGGGLRITRLDRSIVDNWALLTRPGQRAPAILAVSERRTTHHRLRAEPQVVRDETGAVLETRQQQLTA